MPIFNILYLLSDQMFFWNSYVFVWGSYRESMLTTKIQWFPLQVCEDCELCGAGLCSGGDHHHLAITVTCVPPGHPARPRRLHPRLRRAGQLQRGGLRDAAAETRLSLSHHLLPTLRWLLFFIILVSSMFIKQSTHNSGVYYIWRAVFLCTLLCMMTAQWVLSP